MNPAGHHHHHREPITELEGLLTADERRVPISVAAHQAFRESLAPRAEEEIAELIEEIRRAEFEGRGATP